MCCLLNLCGRIVHVFFSHTCPSAFLVTGNVFQFLVMTDDNNNYFDFDESDDGL